MVEHRGRRQDLSRSVLCPFVKKQQRPTRYICPFWKYDDLREAEKSLLGRDFNQNGSCSKFEGTKAELYRHLADLHQGSLLPNYKKD